MLENTVRNSYILFHPLRSCPRLSLLSKHRHVLLSLRELSRLLTIEVRYALRLPKGRRLTLAKTRYLVEHRLLSSLKLGDGHRFKLRLRGSPLLSLCWLSEHGCLDRLAKIWSCDRLTKTRRCDWLERVELGLLKRGSEGLLWLAYEGWLLLRFGKLDPF